MPDGTVSDPPAFTVRGLQDEARERLKQLAEEKGLSLNRFVVGVLTREAERMTEWERLLDSHRLKDATPEDTEEAVRILDSIRDESGGTP